MSISFPKVEANQGSGETQQQSPRVHDSTIKVGKIVVGRNLIIHARNIKFEGPPEIRCNGELEIKCDSLVTQSRIFSSSGTDCLR